MIKCVWAQKKNQTINKNVLIEFIKLYDTGGTWQRNLYPMNQSKSHLNIYFVCSVCFNLIFRMQFLSNKFLCFFFSYFYAWGVNSIKKLRYFVYFFYLKMCTEEGNKKQWDWSGSECRLTSSLSKLVCITMLNSNRNVPPRET